MDVDQQVHQGDSQGHDAGTQDVHESGTQPGDQGLALEATPVAHHKHEEQHYGYAFQGAGHLGVVKLGVGHPIPAVGCWRVSPPRPAA